ncbi:hypothetical protein Cob_v012792 [Colletotrichum orbiculare MAFF 240422]|uniref:Uncharacterized protein n=1 Tax=Colletotrichum orbiculare (strain 104-T / ATCC 96160 / CBS 514.97 / LARS 414 / MAFF 240422) TaxID=1213857 RepID=N4V6R1_COLOR|nr:hypothetical protein Cob_v012792 [Colletotrichum orbiculare MAFF 240422]
MKFSVNMFLAIAAIVSGVSASCVDSSPGSFSFDPTTSTCKKGVGFDHECKDTKKATAYFLCCSNANCT